MTRILQRFDKQVNDILNACDAQENAGGSRVSGGTYEQGVRDGIQWIIGDTDDLPIDPTEYADLLEERENDDNE